MRYRETGQLHLDFHRTLNGTIRYLREHYGEAFLDETFRATAQDVYRAIRDDLLNGDPEQLVEHWAYFFAREGGDFDIARDGVNARLTVRRCPAVGYLMERGLVIDPCFCRQTIVVNQALTEGTPFEIVTELTGPASCVQTLRRRQ